MGSADILDLHSLEIRVRHGRRASLRLTSDEEAACRDARSSSVPCSSHALRKLSTTMIRRRNSPQFRKGNNIFFHTSVWIATAMMLTARIGCYKGTKKKSRMLAS